MSHVFTLSLKLLLHDLNITHENSLLIEKNPGFTGFKLYAPSEKRDKSHLVVGMLSEVFPVAERHPAVTFLCIRDRFVDEEEAARSKANILVLLTNKKLPQLFNEILSIFSRYRDWDMQMHLSTASNQGIQPLVDLTENVIGNHIDIMDSAFRLIGYTRNIPLDDPITEQLISKGYHSDETMRKFLELRRFEQYEKGDDIIVSDDYKLCDYVTVKRVFHTGQKPCMYVVMHCNHREADDSLLDLFRVFLQYAEQYALQNDLHPSAFAASTQYLHSLLDGTITNVDEAISRASYATIPYQHDYRLYALAFADHFNTPLDRIAADINQNLSFSYVLVYHRRIIILHSRGDNSASESYLQKTICRLLPKSPCVIGISNPFSNLWEARTALEQAGCAIEYGTHVHQHASGQEEPPVSFFRFEECMLTLLVTKSYNSSPDLFKNSFLLRAVKALQDYDAEHDSSFLRTLETYLECSQKATETSTKLHMHRNTVLYHIERIEQILGVSLNDSETSIKLYLGIKTWRSNMIEILS